jgi:LuxR family transcriptional regulator, maltose regulon positive regulatory protein
LLHQDGWLLYWQGLTRLSDDPAAAERWLEGAYGVFTRHDDSTGLYLSWAAVVESIFLQWADFSGLDVSLNRFRELQERHPVFPSPQVEVQVYAALVIMAYRNPGTPELPGWAEHARALLASDIDNPTRLRLCAHLINYYVWKTDLNQAAWVLAVARRMADSPGIPPLYLAVSRMFGAMSAWMTGFGEECLRLVDVGIEQAHSAGLHAWDFHFNIQNVYGSLILGRTKEAEASLAAAFLLLRNHRYIDAGYYYFVAGLLAEQRGDCGTAVDYLETALSMTERGGASIPLATVHVALAVPLLRLGNAAGAAQQLERARCLSEETGSGLVRYLCELQSARMALDCGEQENAQTHLARGLSLSRECGGLVCGGWGPKVMARLYAVALDAEIEVPYIRGLIRRIGLTPADPAAAPAQWPWPIRIRTLGRFEILLDDDVLRSSGKAQRKPLDLLKALIALGGRAVPEAHLCEMLWPETDGDAAHRDFSTTLHRLRKLLMNDKALRIENGCLSLDENRVWVDVWAFQKQVAAAGTAHGGKPDRVVVASTLSLYRGDFLPEESSAGALSLRARLRTSYCHAVEELGSALERSGDWGSAADWYLKGLEADPLRELLYGRTMHCYERLGRRAEALALYQRCRQLFLARLGIMPGRELQAHFQRLSSIPDALPVDGSGP